MGMADQYISRDWYVEIETFVDKMKRLERLSEKLQGPPQDLARQDYEDVCHKFLGHLRSRFGSIQGFSEFLQTDLAKKVEQAGRDSTVFAEDASWGIDDHDNYLTANQASGIYLVKYKPFVEGLDYNHSFGRSRLPDFTP